ncbi:MAG TPA: DUF4079 family protein [Candidatus Rifleibacterium sp.]|nr:DUF4079 family protein [Candidatus Rifleibacterium sp.]HPT46303.1 DUF4079 family protein [Candidatus Rifleibacterium sp.]
MKFIHPVFMLFVLTFLFRIHKIGKQALAVNPKSPEADQKETFLGEHAKLSKIAALLFAAGLIGGIVGVVQFMQVNAVFLKTYGHGFAGAILLGLMIANIFVGNSIKTLNKEKSRENLRRFHFNLFYMTLACSLYSLISGLAVLIKGPMS